MRPIGVLAAIAATFALAGAGGAGVYVPPPPGDGWPAWSPDASVIAFTSDREGTSLRVVDPDGSGERRIPWLPANSTYSFSHDWSHIAYSGTDSHVVVERLDGGDRVDLGRAAYLSKPSWSPDGARLTYSVQSGDPNSPDIVVARVDGSEVRRLVPGINPAWSPAGEQIAYVHRDGDAWSIHTVGADGRGDRAVTPPETTIAAPAWSPDGTRIAYAHDNVLEVRDAATGRLAAAAGIAAYQVEWAPGSDRIAVSNGAGISIFDLRTGTVRELTRFGGEIAWSPDGTRLAFAAGGECRDRAGIYSVAVDRPLPARLTNDCRIVGTEGPDILTGTPLADVILGLGGDDRLTAVPQYFSGDTLDGGAGDDTLTGSFEGDSLDGGPGNDVLRGGASADLLVGGPGRDTLNGEGGQDLVLARDGERDVVSCGTNSAKTTGPEGDEAYVDRVDRVSPDCEYVFRPGPAPPVRGRISLVIRVWANGNQGPKSPPRVYTLRCRPAGGTLPRTGTACARLQRIQNPFAPIPRAVACSGVATDPQPRTAGIRGVYGGRAVRLVLGRWSSCEIARWDRLAFLFPLS
jgi:Ca2+-binding RTX toxin-like protein